MLESITIQNFQCHDQLKIDFDPHITTIIGPNDVGKSASNRALRWLCLNRPAGNAHIKDGEKFARVKLRVDGHLVGRHKSSTENVYRIDKNNLKAFGSEVPEPVSLLLNISEINFQQQHDSPYWFCETAGQVSKELNQIVDLSLIDDTMGRIASRLRTVRTAVEIRQKDLRTSREAMEGLSWVPNAATALESIEAQDKERGKIRRRIDSLGRLVVDVETIDRTRDRLTAAGRTLFPLVLEGKKAVNLGKRIESISDLVRQAIYTASVIDRDSPNLTGLTTAVESWKEVTRLRTLLWTWVIQIKTTKEKIDRSKRELEVAEQEIKTKTGGLCPICRNPM